MSRKKEIDGKTERFSIRLTIKEIIKVRLISSVLGISIARFIRVCIQEWISNHSEVMEIINNDQVQ